MSFYGDIKRINSSPYVFDRYYANRAEMEDNASTDGIYVGRYILVKYTYTPVYLPISVSENNYQPGRYYYKNGEDYVLDNSDTMTSGRSYYTYSSYVEKYRQGDNEYAEIELTSATYKKNVYYHNVNGTMQLASGNFSSSDTYYVLLRTLTEEYTKNANKDLERFQDTYDGTVWQKIYTKVTNEDSLGNNICEEKYILVAELNAAAPRMTFRSIAPKQYGYNNDNELVEKWNKPSVYSAASTEDVYTLSMPDILHLEVGDMGDDFYGKSLIDNPAEKNIYSDIDITDPPEDSGITASQWANYSTAEKRHILATSSEYNYMKWKNLYNGEEVSPANKQQIDSKQLDTKLYAFGQLISDLYDVLYGAPANGAAGLRPFYTEDLSNVIKGYDKGLVGILSSIATEAKGDIAQDLYGRKIQNGLYYYFISKWGDASEDPDNFIENIPNVVGASAANQGSSAKSQYYIKFDATDGQYLKKF